MIKQNINLDNRVRPPSLFLEPTCNKRKHGSSDLLVSTLRVGRPIGLGSTLDKDMVSCEMLHYHIDVSEDSGARRCVAGLLVLDAD
jgi:hypothetical protein